MLTRNDPDRAGAVETEQDRHRGDQSTEPVTETAVLPEDTAEVDRSREEVVQPSTTNRPAVEGGPGDLPLPGYRQMTVPEIIRQAADLPLDQLRAVKEYEKSHRRRKTLLTKLERMLRAPRGSGGDVSHPV
jgi:hypothetical protein